jgi:hypothetical protein
MKMGFHCLFACNGVGGFSTLNPSYFWFKVYLLFRVFTLCAMPYALCYFPANFFTLSWQKQEISWSLTIPTACMKA